MKVRFKALTLSAALALGAMTTLGLPATASATTLQLGPLPLVTQGIEAAAPVEKVGHRGDRSRRINRESRRSFSYHSNRHGSRYTHRRGRHKHYNDGYWYAVPFWLGAAALANSYQNTQPYYNQPYYAQPVQRSGHVDWCLNRYRSYNPGTDTFRGYDGYDHRCRSPYHP